jgi:hypothetical protein
MMATVLTLLLLLLLALTQKRTTTTLVPVRALRRWASTQTRMVAAVLVLVLLFCLEPVHQLSDRYSASSCLSLCPQTEVQQEVRSRCALAPLAMMLLLVLAEVVERRKLAQVLVLALVLVPELAQGVKMWAGAVVAAFAFVAEHSDLLRLNNARATCGSVGCAPRGLRIGSSSASTGRRRYK